MTCYIRNCSQAADSLERRRVEKQAELTELNGKVGYRSMHPSHHAVHEVPDVHHLLLST